MVPVDEIPILLITQHPKATKSESDHKGFGVRRSGRLLPGGLVPVKGIVRLAVEVPVSQFASILLSPGLDASVSSPSRQPLTPPLGACLHARRQYDLDWHLTAGKARPYKLTPGQWRHAAVKVGGKCCGHECGLHGPRWPWAPEQWISPDSLRFEATYLVKR